MLVIYIAMIDPFNILHHLNGYRKYDYFIQSLKNNLYQHHLSQFCQWNQSTKGKRETCEKSFIRLIT